MEKGTSSDMELVLLNVCRPHVGDVIEYYATGEGIHVVLHHQYGSPVEVIMIQY